MRILNRYFFIGLGTGVFLTLAVIIVGSYVLVERVITPERLESELPPPKFPEPSNLKVYGWADSSWTIRNLDGKEERISDFKGNVVFINFWATWCKPCVVEMPGIQRLYDSMRGEKVVFVIASGQDTRKLRSFVEKRRWKLPVYVHGEKTPAVFERGMIPVTFILRPDGAIVFEHTGSARWDTDLSRQFIRSLMQ